MVKYDIIIPIFNQSALTVSCLRSIRRFTKDYRLILINNGSLSHEWDTVKQEAVMHDEFLVIENKRNLGFVKAVNQGLKLSDADFVILMNNDTEAVEGWAEKLGEIFEKEPFAGIAGPRTTTLESWQGLTHAGEKWDILPAGSMLAFFCAMIKREVFERTGFLDEIYGAGFGDDDDFCKRAAEAGYSLALRRDLVIPHHHRATFRTLYSEAEIKSMQEKNLDIFRKKHA